MKQCCNIPTGIPYIFITFINRTKKVVRKKKNGVGKANTVGPRITPPHITLFRYCTIFKWFQNVSHSTIFTTYFLAKHYLFNENSVLISIDSHLHGFALQYIF